MLRLALFLLLCSGSLCLEYEDCGSEGKVVDVKVSECDEVDRCPFNRSTSITIGISFEVPEEIQFLTAVMEGALKMGEVQTQLYLPFQRKIAGEANGLSFPLQADVTHQYVNVVPIQQSFPPVEVLVRYQLQDKQKKNHVCILIPAVIV